MELTVGNTAYRLVTTEQSGQWTAHALRAETGERFGVETTAETAFDAIGGLARWLEWQHEHTCALDSLQQAERAYHRSVADVAFAASDNVIAMVGRRASLEQVDAARQRLDDVRARRPNA